MSQTCKCHELICTRTHVCHVLTTVTNSRVPGTHGARSGFYDCRIQQNCRAPPRRAKAEKIKLWSGDIFLHEFVSCIYVSSWHVHMSLWHVNLSSWYKWWYVFMWVLNSCMSWCRVYIWVRDMCIWVRDNSIWVRDMYDSYERLPCPPPPRQNWKSQTPVLVLYLSSWRVCMSSWHIRMCLWHMGHITL